MGDFHADLASLSDCFGDPATSYEDRRRMSYAFVKTYHATIQQNAEDVKEWEEFGRQIEKRLRHNDLGLVGGYPEMIDVLLGMAKQLRALEMAITEFGAITGQLDDAISIGKRADEILREWVFDSTPEQPE